MQSFDTVKKNKTNNKKIKWILIDFFKKHKEISVFAILLIIFFSLLLIATNGLSVIDLYSSIPNLHKNYNPVAINIGRNGIRWYAIFIITGIIFATLMGQYEFSKQGISKTILYDGLIVIVPLSILGGRLFYVVFDKEGIYNSFLDVINLSNGGLAIMGSVITAFICVVLLCLIKKINFFALIDFVAIGFLIGQVVGRWGNFMNQEAFGGVSNKSGLFNNLVPLFVREQMYIYFDLEFAYRHPTFLYESTLNFICLSFLLLIRRFKVLRIGDSAAIYLIWYGLVRAVAIEPYRIDPLYLGDKKINILLPGLCAAIGISFLIAKYIFPQLKSKFPYYYDISREDVKKEKVFQKQSDITRAIIFDLDGTILKTEKIIYNCFDIVFEKHFPHINLTVREKKSFIGPTLRESLLNYTNDEELINKAIKTYKETSLKLHDKMPPKPYIGIGNTFKNLKQMGLKIAICTSKEHEMAKLGLEKSNLLSYVDLIIGSDDVVNPKPNPECLEECITKLGILPNEAFYIGDHPNDIKCAKNINMISIGVRYSMHIDKLKKEEPDFLISNTNEIIELLERERKNK